MAPDSQKIAYISFISVVIIDTAGKKIEEMDLAGLNNFTDLFFNPRDENILYFKARPSQSLASDFNLYRLSRKDKEIKILRKASFYESNYDISPDGRYLVYSKPSTSN